MLFNAKAELAFACLGSEEHLRERPKDCGESACECVGFSHESDLELLHRRWHLKPSCFRKKAIIERKKSML